MRCTTKTVAFALVLSLISPIGARAATPDTSPSTNQKVPASAQVTPAAPVNPVAAAAVPATAPVVPAAAPAVPAVAVKKAESPAAPVSVLERFRTYTGPRTPAAMSALFSAPVMAGITQQPEIVLSSGAVKLNITTKISTQANQAPNFATNGASLMSSELIGKDEWLFQILPEAGVIKAELFVLANGVALEIPLTIAPPLPDNIDLTDKGFDAFLLGRGPGAQPLLDLNGDGRLNYQDDYIYTANYLSNKRSPVIPSQVVTENPYATDHRTEPYIHYWLNSATNR